ncbi:hypothetical protein M0804_003127 [Polistes exclamans]|nr:hypothetical protein M0804_003127 [Polistes exclamans]
MSMEYSFIGENGGLSYVSLKASKTIGVFGPAFGAMARYKNTWLGRASKQASKQASTNEQAEASKQACTPPPDGKATPM